jgi:hypothetical protein
MKTTKKESEEMGLVDKLYMVWFFILLVFSGVFSKGEN